MNWLKFFKKVFSVSSFTCLLHISCFAQQSTQPLKVVIIRHAEKPAIGDNLNCMGLNRSQLLPNVIVSKFGVPAYTYVPSLSADTACKHARMFQTIIPLAVKYNLVINSKFKGKDTIGIATDILKKAGNVLVIWDHKSIVPLIHALGVKENNLKWNENDFDSIWIINYNNGQAILTKDKENLHPAAECL